MERVRESRENLGSPAVQVDTNVNTVLHLTAIDVVGVHFMDHTLNETQGSSLPIFPLNTVLFPGMRLPLHIFEERYKSMITDCLLKEQPFGVTLIQRGQEVGGSAEPHLVGTTARIVDVEYLADGCMNIQTVGECRFRLIELLSLEPYLVASVQLYDGPHVENGCCLRKLVEQAKDAYRQYAWGLQRLTLNREVTQDLPNDPIPLANFVAAHFKTLSLHHRQLLLEILEVEELLSREICWLNQEDRRIRLSLLAREKILELEAKHGQSLQEKRWLN